MAAARPVVLRELAHRDIDEAISYHLGEGVDAARGLVDILEQAFKHIAHHPASGSTRYALELNLAELRSWPLSRYPYLVFYVENTHHVDDSVRSGWVLAFFAYGTSRLSGQCSIESMWALVNFCDEGSFEIVSVSWRVLPWYMIEYQAP